MFERKRLQNKGIYVDFKNRNCNRRGPEHFEQTALKKMIPVLFEYGFLVKYESQDKSIILVKRNTKKGDIKYFLNIIKNNKLREAFFMFKNLSYALVEDGFYGYSIMIVNPINNQKAIYIVKDGKEEYVENG
ncbi:hypothetical protein [Lactococcus petauri]|uniref:hypothetical protein n=1 Tax=Lactococcus petauri TaxID=1940789 RepID=UPI003852D0CF